MPTLRERTCGFDLDSWKRPENHRFILHDKIRLAKFKEAIERNVWLGPTVIDVGAGWGLLSILAAKAGARKVYAVELHKENIEIAKLNFAKEGLSRRIELIHGNSLELPDSSLPKVDVIISETLGFMGIGEGIVGIMHDAKEKWLKEGGILIPESLYLYTASAGLPDPPKTMRMMQIYPDCLRSELRLIKQYKLGEDEHAALVDLEIPSSSAGWFVAELCDDVFLDTSPFQPLTSWEQIYFP